MEETQSKSVLEQIKEHTVIVADTGDFDSIRQYEPRDATTNPSLILKAAKQAEYSELVEDVVNKARQEGVSQVEEVMDRLLVRFGVSILEIVPGLLFRRKWTQGCPSIARGVWPRPVPLSSGMSNWVFRVTGCLSSLQRLGRESRSPGNLKKRGFIAT